MAHNGLDELGNWIGTQEDSGLDVPESAEVFPGSLTADDQEKAMRGSIAVGNVTRVKDQADSVEGLRDAPAADDDGDSDVPVTAAGDKVTADGKKAKSDEDAAPLASSATSEATAEEVTDGQKTRARRAKAADEK